MESAIKNKAVKGMAWVGIEKFARQVIAFALSIVMARLLTPRDYGVVGMLSIFMMISTQFIDSGFGAALIQKKDRTEVDYATVFYFNLAIAIFCYIVLFVASPSIAAFYKMPILKDVCRIVALGLPLGALCTIQRSRMTIMLNFKTQTIVTLVSLIVSGFLGVCLAYKGFGVWALVWQGLCSNIVSIVLLWSLSKWHPLLAFSVNSFKRFFSFGWKHLCSSLINCIYGEIYTLIVGKAFGAAEIGYYTRAKGYAYLPTNTISDMVLRVNFPILAQLQDDREKLISAYGRMLKMPMFLLIPVLFGMAVIATPLIKVMIGEKWLPCVPFLQVLCVGMVFVPLTRINLNLLYVKGRTDCVLRLELIKNPIAFAIAIGTIPLGIFWMCVGKAFFDFVAFSLNCHYTKKLLGYGLWAQLKDVLPIILNSVIMAVIVMVVIRCVASPWLQLMIGVPVGVLSYACAAYLTQDESFKYAMSFLQSKMAKLKCSFQR